MARELIRNDAKAKETLKISGIAVVLAKQRGLERDEEVRSRFFEKLDAKMDQTGPGKDLITLLKQLKHKKVFMGIVSFVRKPRLAKRLDVWKLKDYFACTISPEQIAEFKPSPQPFLKAIENFGLAPKYCFVVGDEPVDMLGGKRAGAHTIGLPQGFYSREELEASGADSIITSLKAIPSILFK